MISRSFNRIVALVIETLPEAVPARVEILEHLLNIVPANHPQFEHIKSCLAHLQSHQRTQLELPGILRSESSSGRAGGNGNGKGRGK